VKKTKFLLCDDERLLRDALAQAISKWPWVDDQVDTASNGAEAMELLSAQVYDILLLDMNMPGSKGVEVAKEVYSLYPETKIIMLTNHAGEALILSMYRTGVHGFILKNTPLIELEKIIQAVLAGERHFPSTIKDIIERSNRPSKVPEITIASRHKQVLELLLLGKDPKTIADILHLTVNTVNSYKSEMMKQTQTQSTPELLAFIQKNGLS
jgi:DNA-binding NarL/FixJ family response regulator